jgi:hypothetical protein
MSHFRWKKYNVVVGLSLLPYVCDKYFNYFCRKTIVRWRLGRRGFCFQTILQYFFYIFYPGPCRLSGVGFDWRLYNVHVSVGGSCMLLVVECLLLIVGCRCRWLLFWLLIVRCSLSGAVCLLSVSFVAQFFHCRCPALRITFVQLQTYYMQNSRINRYWAACKSNLTYFPKYSMAFFLPLSVFPSTRRQSPCFRKSVLYIWLPFLLNFILSYFSTYWLCELKKF